jgi:hypothetical protein
MAASEPFPILNTSADQLHTPSGDGAPRRRRKSSVIGSEFRIGDPDSKLRGGLVSADGASQVRLKLLIPTDPIVESDLFRRSQKPIFFSFLFYAVSPPVFKMTW